MKQIELSSKTNHLRVAIIDDCDFDIISKFRWYFASGSYGYSLNGPKNGYAYTRLKTSDSPLGRNVYMHRMILNAQPGQEVEHLNDNGLDNRRENIRICTHSDNMIHSYKNRKERNK